MRGPRTRPILCTYLPSKPANWPLHLNPDLAVKKPIMKLKPLTADLPSSGAQIFPWLGRTGIKWISRGHLQVGTCAFDHHCFRAKTAMQCPCDHHHMRLRRLLRPKLGHSWSSATRNPNALAPCLECATPRNPRTNMEPIERAPAKWARLRLEEALGPS